MTRILDKGNGCCVPELRWERERERGNLVTSSLLKEGGGKGGRKSGFFLGV